MGMLQWLSGEKTDVRASGNGVRNAPGRLSSMNHAYDRGIDLCDESAASSHRVRMEEQNEMTQEAVRKQNRAQTVPSNKQQWTQADEDKVRFTSVRFEQYLSTQDPILRKFVEWQRNQCHEMQEQDARHLAELRRVKTELENAENMGKELKQLRKELQKTQSDALNAIDRFQPTPDGTVLEEVSSLSRKIDGVIKNIGKCANVLAEPEWLNAALPLMHHGTYAAGSLPQNLEFRILRRMMLRNIIWRFLDENIFSHPFGGYKSLAEEKSQELYQYLYPRPELDPDSNNWRSLTAIGLENMLEQNQKTTRQIHLSMAFKDHDMCKLGYQQLPESLLARVSSLMGDALRFWQLTAKQRAVYKFKFYSCAETSPLIRHEEDVRMTSIEFGDDDIEQTGVVWFVTRPGLTKRGNGQGRNLDQVIMLPGFKAHVMLVDDTRYEPQKIPMSDTNLPQLDLEGTMHQAATESKSLEITDQNSQITQDEGLEREELRTRRGKKQRVIILNSDDTGTSCVDRIIHDMNLPQTCVSENGKANELTALPVMNAMSDGHQAGDNEMCFAARIVAREGR